MVFQTDKATVPTIQKYTVDCFFVSIIYVSICINFVAHFIGNLFVRWRDCVGSYLLYSSLSVWYMSDVLSAKTNSFFNFLLAFNWFWKWLTFWNFLLLTMSHKSHSNGTISLTFGGQFNVFKPCLLHIVAADVYVKESFPSPSFISISCNL